MCWDVGKGFDRLRAQQSGMLVLAVAFILTVGLWAVVLAAQAIMYYAQSMGIGSCMIGFAETALNIKRSMRSAFGIDDSQKTGLVFTLGYPDVKYLRLPIRKPIPVTFYKEEE